MNGKIKSEQGGLGLSRVANSPPSTGALNMNDLLDDFNSWIGEGSVLNDDPALTDMFLVRRYFQFHNQYGGRMKGGWM